MDIARQLHIYFPNHTIPSEEAKDEIVSAEEKISFQGMRKARIRSVSDEGLPDSPELQDEDGEDL